MWQQYRGTGVALVTPFHQDGSIDFDGLKNVIEHCIEGKLDYLVSLGTTGESVTLTKKEKHQVLDFTVETVAGRVPVVAGFGGNNTQSIINSIKGYHFKGISAILSASPSYNKPTQEGIYQHYKALASATELPIILYNVPSRTASNMTAETTLRLAHDIDNIIAVKEASGDLEQCMQIVKNKPKDFLVISGDDVLTLPILSFGGDGVISVVANAFPRQFSDMVRAGLANDFKTAAGMHLPLIDTINLLFAEGNPAGIKCVLNELGICKEYVRLPLVGVSDTLRQNLRSSIAVFEPASA